MKYIIDETQFIRMHWPMTVTNCSEQCIVVLRSTFEKRSSKYLCGLTNR
jgi:hypothetical protein